MANEMQISSSLVYTKVNDSRNTAFSFQDDVAGSLRFAGVQTIGTGAEEALAMGDMTDVGWVWVHNLDDTNFVLIATVPSEHFTIKLGPGKAHPFYSAGSAVYAKADTAPVKLAYELYSV